MENKNYIAWVIGGVVLAAVIIYFVVIGGINLRGGPTSPEAVGPAATSTPQGIVAAPGLSPVTEEGTVVTREGAPVQQDVEPGSPNAPQQSAPLTESDIPKAAVRLNVSAAGFDPAEFTVDAGEAVTLTLTSTETSDTGTHLFYFDDASLRAVAIGVGPGETRAITFNVPTQKGEYSFHCDVPGHAGRGEVGKMIVK